MNSLDVEISDDTFIIPKETALAYRERLQKEKEQETTPSPPESEKSGTGEAASGAESPQSCESSGGKEGPSAGSGHATEAAVKSLSWSGDVPPQKWMNFYTKVLSKYATDRSLKLKVTFEVAPENGITKERLDEIQAALRELGLPADIETGTNE